MTIVDVFLFDDLDVTYSANVTDAAFNANDFNSFPSSETGIAVTQLAANQLRVTFSGPINADNELEYSGASPGILTPQTISF